MKTVHTVMAFINGDFDMQTGSTTIVLRSERMGPPRAKGSDRVGGDRLHIAETVAALASFWLPSLERMTWRQRLDLLEVIDAELAGCHPGDKTYEEISRKFVLRLLERTGELSISCREQALIYLNSSLESHRIAAETWLSEHHGKPS